MANHLVIGLGGTGGAVLRALRKKIHEEYSSNNPTDSVNIEYLYVDTNAADLGNEADWQSEGVSVQLFPAQRLLVHEADARLFENINWCPGIKSFIDKNDEKILQEKAGDAVSTAELRRSRRWGRMLMAYNMCGLPMDTFTGYVHSRVRALQEKENTDNVTFHICAGLGGATGSGFIVDAVAQIRNEFQRTENDNQKYRILLYLYVPESISQIPEGEASNRFYQPNGYAALLELNAMATGKYCPTDIKGTTDDNGNVNRLLKGQDAFDMAFLYTNTHEKGNGADFYEELPHIVSDFLFYTTLGLNDNSVCSKYRFGHFLDSAISSKIYDADSSVYSRCFMTFGVSRIKYPETEIKEYYAYNLSYQYAMQMLYGLWDETKGFVECTEEMAGKTGILDVERERESNLLTDDYLTLGKPLPSLERHTPNWKPIIQEWEFLTDCYKQDVQAEYPKKEWYEKLDGLCHKFFDTMYRGTGVKKFYSDNESQLLGYAEEIIRRIENNLFNNWKNGTLSVLEVYKYINMLIIDSNERIEDFKAKITKQTSCLNDDLAKRLEGIRREQDNTNRLKELFTDNYTKTFEQFADAKREEMTLMHTIYGQGFAVKLLSEIVNSLTFLQKTRIAPLMRTLQDFSNMVRALAEEKDKHLEEVRCGALKIHDPKEVRNILSTLLLNEERLKENAADWRKFIIATIAANCTSFSGFTQYVSCHKLFSITHQKVLMNACKDMEDYSVKHPDSRLTNVNVLELLRKTDCSTEDKRRQFVGRLYDACQQLLAFNAPEKNLHNGRKTFILYLPMCKEHPEFRNELIKDFCLHPMPGISADDVTDYSKENQIVLVTMYAPFPLYCIDNVQMLKKKYDMLAKEDANWVHTDNSIIGQLP